MTDVDFNGKRTHKPKEIWLDKKLYDIPLQIEEEFCRQANKGLIRDPKEAKIILEFIKRSKNEK